MDGRDSRLRMSGHYSNNWISSRSTYQIVIQRALSRNQLADAINEVRFVEQSWGGVYIPLGQKAGG